MKDFEKLKAGKELDIFIAENIFGWVRNDLGYEVWYDGNTYTPTIKEYSTDISAALEIEEMLRIKFGKTLSIETMHYAENDVLWDVKFEGQKIYTRLSSLPHAICKAALLAVMDS